MKRHLILCALTATVTSFSPLSHAGEGDRVQAMALLTGADALATGGAPDKAIELCRRALGLDPSCPAAHLKLGQYLEQGGKPREAFKSYRSASEYAKKENDAKTQRSADEAAKKLGAGLLQIAESDQKLIPRLLKLASDA